MRCLLPLVVYLRLESVAVAAAEMALLVVPLCLLFDRGRICIFLAVFLLLCALAIAFSKNLPKSRRREILCQFLCKL